MIDVGIFESEPYKIKSYINSIIMKNNISYIHLITAPKSNVDIAIVYDKIHSENIPPILIINSDLDLSGEKIEINSPVIIIDCGISLKSSVTVSSCADGQLTCCIQRGFSTLLGTEISPQEFKVPDISEKEPDIFNLLACITIFLLAGISVEEIQNYKF